MDRNDALNIGADWSVGGALRVTLFAVQKHEVRNPNPTGKCILFDIMMIHSS